MAPEVTDHAICELPDQWHKRRVRYSAPPAKALRASLPMEETSKAATDGTLSDMVGKRRSREQVLSEFHWLHDCFDAFLAAHGPVEGIDYSKLPIRTREASLALLDQGAIPLSELMTGLRQAISDQLRTMKYLPRDNPAKGAALRANYLALRGRSFEDDIALARQQPS